MDFRLEYHTKTLLFRGENVEEAFLDTARKIYQNIQDGRLSIAILSNVNALALNSRQLSSLQFGFKRCRIGSATQAISATNGELSERFFIAKQRKLFVLVDRSHGCIGQHPPLSPFSLSLLATSLRWQLVHSKFCAHHLASNSCYFQSVRFYVCSNSSRLLSEALGTCRCSGVPVQSGHSI